MFIFFAQASRLQWAMIIIRPFEIFTMILNLWGFYPNVMFLRKNFCESYNFCKFSLHWLNPNGISPRILFDNKFFCKYLESVAYPGGMHRMHVHPPPGGVHPPLPSLKGWLWEKMRKWATRKKCKFVYLRLDNFLPRIIKYKKQSFHF